MRFRSRWAPLLAALLVTMGATGSIGAPQAHAAAARGVSDTELTRVDSATRVRLMDEYAQLRVRYLKIELHWSRAEPADDVYDEPYLEAIEHSLDLARERGIRVILTVMYTPTWASDTTLWSDPPFPSVNPPGVYRPFYAPKAQHIPDFGAFAAYLAARYAGRVFAYECWNEPNLWVFLYPQTRGSDDRFAVRRYRQLLEAFYEGVRSTDPDALVIGGATAPVGANDRYRTSPQRFARNLKEEGGAAYLDAYSHHPYTPGGTADMAPEAMPKTPSTTVQLRNLKTLLDLYPGKPFYLTEYGYNTSFSAMFGGQVISPDLQASYLRRAYRYAGGYTRVKALLWYLRRDVSPSGKSSDARGVYTGLRTVDSRRKKSWFAFAGGNRLTMSAPRSVRRGSAAALSGALTSSRLALTNGSGGIAGRTLLLQLRAGGGWRTLKTVKTGAGGRYRTGVKVDRSSTYRLLWKGVTVSPARRVTAS